jgi:hypothetical protein
MAIAISKGCSAALLIARRVEVTMAGWMGPQGHHPISLDAN